MSNPMLEERIVRYFVLRRKCETGKLAPGDYLLQSDALIEEMTPEEAEVTNQILDVWSLEDRWKSS